MNLQRIKQLRKELKKQRLDLVEIAEIEAAFNLIPQEALRDLKENATTGDMLDELEVVAKQWATIDNDNVRLVFRCESEKKCGNVEFSNPDHIVQGGTLICPSCDQDMTYSHAEIKAGRYVSK